MVALVPVATQGRCPAELDGVHDPQMITGQFVGFPVNLAVLTENVRNLETAGWSHPDYEIGCAVLSRGEVTWDRFNRLT
jgi:hypothetical protein